MSEFINNRINVQKSRNVKTAVIAAAGYGTRFLPFTQAVPKELLPIGNRPIIQRLIDECVDIGMDKVVVMTRSGLNLIGEFFEGNEILQEYLEKKGGHSSETGILRKGDYPNVRFVPANPLIPYGNAQGVLTIKEELELEERFLLLWGDDLILDGNSSIQTVVDKYRDTECDAVIGVKRIERNLMRNYGNVAIKDGTTDEVKGIVSKPSSEDEIVSDIAVVGQMVLPGNIFDYINKGVNKAGEPDVTDVGVNELAKEKKVVTAELKGTWITVGDPKNYMFALIGNFIHSGGSPNELINYINSL